MKRRAVGKMVAIPLEEAGEGVALDGIYLGVALAEGGRADARGGAVVAPPHPLYGGSMENPVVTELAFACERAELESLRFDWRGVGASGGEATGDVAAAVEDYRAALRHMEATSDGVLTACGYSFGAAAAVRAAARHPRVRRLVLVAPPPTLLDRDALAGLRGGTLVLAGADDTLARPEALGALVDGLNQVRLEPIPGADHFFRVGLGAIQRLAADFLSC